MQTYLKKNKTVIAVCIILSLLTISIAAIASDRESVRKLNEIVRYAATQGWDYRTSVSGRYLSQGNYYVFQTTLFSGNTYKIVAAGDGTVRDLDILLYDENKNLIDQDQGSDALPIVEVSPRWTGTFYVAVRMYSGYGYSNVAVLYR